MRRRFFVEGFEDGSAVMRGEAAHHLGRVLRAQVGQMYELSDGSAAWLARVDEVTRDTVTFALVEPVESTAVVLETTLYLAVVKFDSFEWAIEKATELGVARVVPLAAARSEKALLAAAVKRAERWRKILLEASQQSRRLRVPELGEMVRAEEAFTSREDGLRVMLSEAVGARGLREILDSAAGVRKVALAIGPEGGWTEGEFGAAREGRWVEASMGRLILRTETAVVAGLACLNFALSE
jgi:16S rRNA (uracil1498-N3)-methyltransferase